MPRWSLAALVASSLLSLAACALAGKPAPAVPAVTKSPSPTPLPAPAAAPESADQPLRPNLFEVKGGTLSVTYSTSGVDGNPHFNYQDTEVTVAATGSQIRSEETEIGTLVTITIVRTVDTGSTSFSLLVPRVNVEPRTRTASVSLIGITTRRRFSPVPIMNRGQLQLGSPVVLSGTAKVVSF